MTLTDRMGQLFFPLYIVFEIPSNMGLKHLRPSLYLPGIMFTWGEFSTINHELRVSDSELC